MITCALRWSGTIGLLSLCLAGCVTPATGPETYVAKVHLTVSDATSELRTASLASRAWLDDRLAGAYVEVVVVSAESALDAVESTFSSIQPPPDRASEMLADRASEVLGRGSEAIQELRVAIRQEDKPAARRAIDAINDAAGEAEALAERTA